jgi:hypothetical protein
MLQVSRKRLEGGAMVAFVLLFFAATPALADEFAGGAYSIKWVRPNTSAAMCNFTWGARSRS